MDMVAYSSSVRPPALLYLPFDCSIDRGESVFGWRCFPDGYRRLGATLFFCARFLPSLHWTSWCHSPCPSSQDARCCPSCIVSALASRQAGTASAVVQFGTKRVFWLRMEKSGKPTMNQPKHFVSVSLLSPRSVGHHMNLNQLFNEMEYIPHLWLSVEQRDRAHSCVHFAHRLQKYLQQNNRQAIPTNIEKRRQQLSSVSSLN